MMNIAMLRPDLPLPKSLIRFLLGGLIAVACTGGALAAEPKPDFTVKAKFIDGSIALDDAIRANPPLAADLLKEGKRWIGRNRADAATEFKTSPELFRDGRAWTFERSYSQTSKADGRYVSIVRTDYTNTGGAHPNTFIDTILWDNESKKRISVRPFFKETADNGPTLKALRAAAIDAVKAEKKQRGIDDSGVIDWYKDIKPTLLKIGAISLAPSTVAGKSAGLEFHYSPYAVGPYVEGSYAVFVPWETFKPYLSPQGLAVFAGDRPPDAKPDRK